MKITEPITLPVELRGDPRRQAVPSIRGTIYQAWCSIDTWLRLNSAEQVIYLEGAEDFDIVDMDNGIAVQVKHNDAAISLGSIKSDEALTNFWKVSTNEGTRQVDFHYLTTSTVAKEREAAFDGICGLDAWAAARTSIDMAEKVAGYLKLRLKQGSPLQVFIASASPAEIQERLFRRFFWFTDQPGIDSVQLSVTDRIRVLLHSLNKSVSLAAKVRVQLESRFWELVREPKSTDRRLTFGELLLQVEIATTAYLPVPLDKLPELLGGAKPGLGLLRLLIHEVLAPPHHLIERTELVHSLEKLVNHRRPVLLTGTVFKGKTTVAQLVAHTLCPNAWWINLTDRQPLQVDTIFLALADEIDRGVCPPLVVIDDLDIAPLAHRTYRDSLSLILHRAKLSGLAVLMTAQGGSCDAALISEIQGVEIVDVPELTREEVIDLCIRKGCPSLIASLWGMTVHAISRGHPKLVQVRVCELETRRWPDPDATVFTGTISAADSVRHMARRFLNDSMSHEMVELLYVISESVTLLHRSVALLLIEKICAEKNPGDLLDKLVGRWIECIERDWFRATPILSGSAREVWSGERCAIAHVQLYDAIIQKKNLDPAEGAALLYHAYFGKEPRRIANAALTLQLIDNTQAMDSVKQNLLWLPYVALTEADVLSDDAFAVAALRSLQFQVAVTLDADTLPQICERWIDEAAQIPHPQMRQGMQQILWGSIWSAENQKVPLRLRLNGILALSGKTISGEITELWTACIGSFLEGITTDSGIPNTATNTQMMLALSTRWVKDLSTLREIFEWLDCHVTDEIRCDFETILSWPIVQTMGAFVHGAWAAKHEETTDWAPWLVMFESIDSYAKRRSSPKIGREAAKATAIILTEQLNRVSDAFNVLSDAEESFGKSSILSEQRVNVLFQSNNDESVLEIWGELVNDPVSKATLDTFAFRRAAISAARLERWVTAEEIFRDAITSTGSEGLECTKFGLFVDCALAVSLGGSPSKAAETILDAIVSMPASAEVDGNEQWEAVQRAATEVCRQINDSIWKPSNVPPKFQPGYASSPALRVEKCEPNQAMRTAFLRAEALHLCASLGVSLDRLQRNEFEVLGESHYPYVRWIAAKARLAKLYSDGAGTDFIKSLVIFDAAMSTFENLKGGVVTRDEGVMADSPRCPERWFALLVAGVCCAGPDIEKHLDIWLEDCRSMPVVLKGVATLIQEFKIGVSIDRTQLQNVVQDTSAAKGLRSVAAAKLLQEALSPQQLLATQGFLVSALVSDGSYVCQEMYNHHVAIRFSKAWEKIAENPFLLNVPRIAVPILQNTIMQVTLSGGTLRLLLLAASKASGQSLDDFMDRVR